MARYPDPAERDHPVVHSLLGSLLYRWLSLVKVARTIQTL